MTNFFRILFLPITAPLDFITKYFKAIIFLTIVLLIVGSMEEEQGVVQGDENLAKIYLRGPIFDAVPFLEELRGIDKENIKGVLMIVDSPGGLVAPSVEIALAIKELAERKEVVVYASGTMASGSYYAAIWGDRIIANPGSMIGSIGVIFEGFNAKKLADKIGIEPQVVKAGKYKEVGAIYREWSEIERREIERVVNAQYDMFVGDVANARGLNIADSPEFAEGRLFIATEAQKLGLIDRVGNISLAESELIARSKVGEAKWVEESEVEKYMKRMFQEASLQIVSSLLFSRNY